MEEDAWASNVRNLCSRFSEIVCTSVINQKQCSVLALLADCIGQYVECWNTIIGQQKLSMAEIGKELLRVLENGIQLIERCAEKDSPAIVFIIFGCKGQVSEIIDDARVYTQMINRLIVRALKSLPDSQKQQSIENLIFKVESDCNSLQFCLKWASKQDKATLLHSFKCQFEPFKSISRCLLGSSSFAISNLLLILETKLQTFEFQPNIRDIDLVSEQVLGKGAFGNVKRAVWYQLPVAVKEFFHETSLEEELKLFLKLLHEGSPHIVQMLGHTKKKLVLELMDTDLRKLIEGSSPNSPFLLIQTIDMMLQVSKAVRHLHHMDVIHRDIKPSNVLVKFSTILNGSPIIKLADLGISKENFETAKTNTARMGTPMYMAPEMLEDKKNYSKKVDVYSFGLICVEILRWEIRPGKSFDEMRHLTKNGERPKLPKDIPKKLKSLIHSCIEYDEKKRPSFQDICDTLWIVKEEALTKVADREEIKLKLTINGLGGLKIESPYTDPTFTSKKAIYCYDIYSVRYLNLHIDILDDIILSSIWDVNSFGELVERDHEVVDLFRELERLLKDQSKKLNLYLEIGGWDHSKHFSDAFSSTGTRNTFVKSLLKLVKTYRIVNGLVINWMHISDNGKNYGKEDNTTSKDDVDNLVVVLQELREKLQTVRPSFIIALTCTSIPGKQWRIEKVVDLVDEIHIVSTHFHSGEWDSITAHQSNLLPSSHAKYSVDEAVKMYIKRGVSSAKIYIGGALMALGFANTDGMGERAEGGSPNRNTPYNKLPVDGSVEKWDDEAKAAYAHDPARRVIDSYDNYKSMIEKAKYVKKNNLGGIVVWDGSYDFSYDHERSVMKALHDHLTSS